MRLKLLVLVVLSGFSAEAQSQPHFVDAFKGGTQNRVVAPPMSTLRPRTAQEVNIQPGARPAPYFQGRIPADSLEANAPAGNFTSTGDYSRLPRFSTTVVDEYPRPYMERQPSERIDTKVTDRIFFQLTFLTHLFSGEGKSGTRK